jgi:hypothetical protein
VVVFGLVCCKRLGAGGETAGVGPVAGVAEEVAREFAALLEVLGRGVAGLPAAEARGARVDVGGFGVRVEIGGAGEGRKAEDAGRVLPVSMLLVMRVEGWLELFAEFYARRWKRAKCCENSQVYGPSADVLVLIW